MKIVAIIQARMGSTRLPNKVLMPVLGKPLLGWMIDRVAACHDIDDVVIATTTLECDDQIVDYANSRGCGVYRGSSDDVLDRYYQSASLNKADVVVRLTADCPLHDSVVINQMIRNFISMECDFLSNSEPLPSTWPDGVDVSIFSFSALKQAWKKALKPSEREHVTFYFWNNSDVFKCKRVDSDVDYSKYRITIDYPEDFLLIKAIIEHFNTENPTNFSHVTMQEIIRYLDKNPKIFALNSKYSHGIGWETSFNLDKSLGF